MPDVHVLECVADGDAVGDQCARAATLSMDRLVFVIVRMSSGVLVHLPVRSTNELWELQPAFGRERASSPVP
jgi:hypothetical protein